MPDDPAQATSDHGWDIEADFELLKTSISRMKEHNIRTSLFIDEDPNIPPAAKEVGADRVELYTGPYGATMFGSPDCDFHLQRLSITARAAKAAGLGINGGHDLTLKNLTAFVKAVPNLSEVSIGHGITSDALIMGFAEAVGRYKAVLNREK